jgi:hypothetical protein
LCHCGGRSTINFTSEASAWPGRPAGPRVPSPPGVRSQSRHAPSRRPALCFESLHAFLHAACSVPPHRTDGTSHRHVPVPEQVLSVHSLLATARGPQRSQMIVYMRSYRPVRPASTFCSRSCTASFPSTVWERRMSGSSGERRPTRRRHVVAASASGTTKTLPQPLPIVVQQGNERNVHVEDAGRKPGQSAEHVLRSPLRLSERTGAFGPGRLLPHQGRETTASRGTEGVGLRGRASICVVERKAGGNGRPARARNSSGRNGRAAPRDRAGQATVRWDRTGQTPRGLG